MNGSNGNVVSLLERIAKGQEDTRDEIKGLRHEIKGLRQDMDHGFAQVNGRLDNLLVFTGKSHADLAKRVTALERKVFKKTS